MLIISLLITAVDIAAFDDAFYKREYTELNTASGMGITDDQLTEATDVLLGYLKDDCQTLDYTTEIQGVDTEF